MFARFSGAPIGSGLIAADAGLTVATSSNSTSLARIARGNLGISAGVAGAEFVAWGDADALLMAIGVVKSTDSLNAMVGANGSGIGWRLDEGKVYIGNVAVASGIAIPEKGDIVGVRIDLAGGTIKFYKGATLVHSRAIGAGTWYFAVSLGSAIAGELACAVNAGQWIPAGPAAAAGWGSDAASAVDLRLADIDYLTAASDTPAHTRFEGLVNGGIETFQAMHFWPWGGSVPAQGGNAQVELLDAEGLLDEVEDVDGACVEVRSGTLTGTLASSSAVARFRADQLEVLDDVRKVLHLRDAHDELDHPLARSAFLPRTPALAWRPVPVVIGAVCSVPALAAVADGSVAFLCDGPLASCETVLDRGDALEDADWSLDPSAQQLLLASSPLGPVVADVSSRGTTMQPTTLQETLTEIFSRAGVTAWSTEDAAAIDTDTGYAGIGYYAGDDQSCRTALQAILPSYGAWFFQDSDGTIRIARAIDPDSVADEDLAFDLAEVDLAEDLLRIPDEAPNLSRRMAYQPNAFVHSPADLVTDLVDVPPQRRIELTSPYRGQVYSTVAMAARYRHADAAPPLVSCFYESADAQAELDRVCGLYAVSRYFYRWREQGNTKLAPKPGDVGRITYSRYGLSAGRKVMVRDVQRNPVTGDITLTLWGA